jgi:aminomuconate-semialdehyde/2-hydroxymuconate-6-semialdehyde dehydrogenase
MLSNYINGEFHQAVSGRTIPVFEPATGLVYGSLPDSGEDDVAMAYDAARKAFYAWKNLKGEERFYWLNQIADAIDQRSEALAMAESMDNGKPVSLARKVDIPRASANFRFFATAAMQFSSESHDMPGLAINYTLRQPVGVVGCISPWNLPLYLFTWKIAPALASGNTVVAKPSELTPYTAYLLAEICRDIGLPAGVLNIVHGYGASCGQSIVTHPGIKAISFTGGTATGESIAALAAPKFKKLSLELGGKNATVIFGDADFEDALRTAVAASFSNQGQICLCGSRIYVQRTVYERFRDAFVQAVASKKVGDPAAADTDIGALVSESHMHKVMSYIQLAIDEGGELLCGGERVHLAGRCETGWFLSPAVISGLSTQCRTNQEEIFGPVVTLQPFDTEEEVLADINHSRYGLACSLWTRDLSRAHRMASAIETGIVWVNCWLLRDLRTPFGGMKDSGVGREGGWEAMRFFTEPKNVCIKY